MKKLCWKRRKKKTVSFVLRNFRQFIHIKNFKKTDFPFFLALNTFLCSIGNLLVDFFSLMVPPKKKNIYRYHSECRWRLLSVIKTAYFIITIWYRLILSKCGYFCETSGRKKKKKTAEHLHVIRYKKKK